MTRVAAALVVFGGVAMAQTPSAMEVLQSTIKAIGAPKAIAADVRDVDGFSFASRPKVRAHAHVLAAPGGKFFSKLVEDESGAVRHLAVRDGKNAALSRLGTVVPESQMPPTIGEPYGAYRYATALLKVYLDPSFYEGMLKSGTLVYGGENPIDGEACHVLVHVGGFPRKDFKGVHTTYLWISQKTNLPRSMQEFFIYMGISTASERPVFSNVRLDADVPDETFAYRPKASDTVPLEPSLRPAGTTRVFLTGKPVPDVELLDYSGAKKRLASVITRPALITLWGTWCGPCRTEMPMFQRLLDRYPARFDVIAIATGEETATTKNFIGENPSLKFVFLHDPDALDGVSRLKQKFGPEGFPFNVLVDAKGVVVDSWTGVRNESQLGGQIASLLN